METNLQRAWQLYRFRRYAMALEETVKFLGQYPENAEAFCLAALIHGKEKRQRQAIEAAEAAIRYMPDWSYPHYVYALVAYWFNKYDLALKSLAEALRIQPTDPDFYELLSAIHAVKGHLNTSLKMAETGLAYDAEHIGCLFRLGAALFDLNRKNEAESVFRKILTIEPEHASAQGYVGHFLVLEGKQNEALPLLRSALKDNPEWSLAQVAWKEAIRGRYRWYGMVANLKNLLFNQKRMEGRVIILVSIGSVVFCFFILLLSGKTDQLLYCLAMSILMGLPLAGFLMAILSIAFSLYLAIVSNLLLFHNDDLRRSFTWNPIPKELRQIITNHFVLILLWVIIIALIIVISVT
ncbi:MAG TPA: hypothetical protein PLN21_22575 [Gemmatales bacterium]|nr:hypothetical protein [Gemmatales bacterium]